jgi:transposase
MQIIGVDIARSWLDVSSLSGAYFRLPNDRSGFQQLSARLPVGAKLCMEATGVYYRPLAFYLAREGFTVYVVNPYQIKSFARGKLSRHKTDKTDSRLIAEYLSHFEPDLTPWDSAPDSLYLLSLIVRFTESLTVQHAGNLNRLHAMSYAHPSLLPVLSFVVGLLQSERERLDSVALDILAKDRLLSAWRKVLKALPGFGDVLTLRFLAHAGDLRRFRTARAFAAYTGLTPKLDSSGRVNRPAHISRLGPGQLRAVLYLASLSASRTRTSQGEFYRSLVKAGKPKKLAMTALANRLARAAWSVCVKG